MSSRTEVELIKKATCSAVNIQNNKQYLVMGASGTEITVSNGFRSVSALSPALPFLLHEMLTVCWCRRYRLPLDSEALVELWPTDCRSSQCVNYMSQLEDFALDLQLEVCPKAS